MNKFIKLLFSIHFVVLVVSSTLFADAVNGEKLYSKNLKEVCSLSGSSFAAKHTQDEWEEFYDAGKFTEELEKICPNLKIEKSWVLDLYEFVYEFANDSGKVPGC
jgi:hypothetical protein